MIIFFRYVWTHATDGQRSQLRIFSVPNHNTGLKELGTVEPEADLGAVKTLQYVPGVNTSGNVYLQDSSFDPLREDQVWVGTESKKIMILSSIFLESSSSPIGKGRVLSSLIG